MSGKRKPWLSLIPVPNPRSKTGGMHLLVATRPYRSKWVTVTCMCKDERKSGGCRTTDAIVPLLAHPDRTRIKHAKEPS